MCIAQLEAVVAENQALELRVSQLIRNSRSLEAEVDTLRAQVSARDIALEELSTELKTAHAQKSQTEDSAILKQKIEDLNVEASTEFRSTGLFLFVYGSYCVSMYTCSYLCMDLIVSTYTLVHVCVWIFLSVFTLVHASAVLL